MKRHVQDLRIQTLDFVLAGAGGSATHGNTQVTALIDVWLNSLEEEDLVGITPESLASVLWDGFSGAAQRSQAGCQIESLRFADGRGGEASALLILNQDMPFLVDSIVMTMRKMHIASRAVLNAVLSVQRAADGSVTAVNPAKNGGFSVPETV